MTEAMHHRGPDETGYFLQTVAPGLHVGMGHKRLSIIDLSSGQQPMANEDGSIRVVFNGEIYNHAAVRADLIRAGHTFRTRCDTEVLVHGYEEYGPELVRRLDGMFAFGIWDERKRTWFLARDRVGIKPLYYAFPEPGSIAFASEIKPLLGLLPAPKPHLAALYRYLLFGYVSSEETIFQGVHQLLPAHSLTFRQGQVAKRRYWSLDDAPELPRGTAWPELLAERLEAAVRSHLEADVPVGITLSGGLDSSAVLAMAAKILPAQQIQAFTVGYGLENDEFPYARMAAAHVGVTAHERNVSVERTAEVFAKVIWHLEEPIAHPVVGTTYFLSEFVRENLKVILIGEGSDELFAGYPHFRLFTPPYSWAPGFVRRQVLPAAAFVMPSAAVLEQFLEGDLLDRPLLRDVSRVFDPYMQGNDPAQAWLRCEIEHQLVHSQLARVDKLTMAHSVEARVPFLDRAFLETAYRVPFAIKRAGGIEKAVLREAMRNVLPRDVLHRPKSGAKGTQNLLPVLLERVLRNKIADLVSPRTLAARCWFRPDAVGAYLRSANSWWVKRHPIDSRRRTKFLFAIAALEQWAQLFLDKPFAGAKKAAA
jgi:asparagine synthase (glutamine-hydrolysing)